MVQRGPDAGQPGELIMAPGRHQPAQATLRTLGGTLTLMVLVTAGLLGLSALGGAWVLLPLLPAGYGLGRVILWAVTH